MPKVRLKTLLASPAGISQPGTEIECGDGEAKRLVDAGCGVLVETTANPPRPAPEPEAATREAPEAAVSRKGRARRPSGEA